MDDTVKGRDSKVDSLKFLLVLLVIIGHVVGPYKDIYTNMILKDYIYMFHIPLFVYISGYLSKNQQVGKWGGVWSIIIETYAVFQILYLLPLSFNYKLSFRYLIVPQWLMWYLFSLLIWRLIKMVVMDKLPSIKPRVWIAISFGVSFFSGFVPITSQFSFQRTCTFFPFFVLGLYTPYNYLNKIKTFNKIVALSIMLLIAIIVVCMGLDFTSVIASSHSYPFFGESLLLSGFYRLCFLFVACIMGICVTALCPDNEFMAQQGKQSMIYYLYHGFLVLLMKTMIDSLGLPYNTFFLLVYFIPIIVILFLFSRTRLSLFLLNPITKTWKKK